MRKDEQTLKNKIKKTRWGAIIQIAGKQVRNEEGQDYEKSTTTNISQRSMGEIVRICKKSWTTWKEKN